MTNKLYIFSDGGARGNPGPGAIGFLIKNTKGKVLAAIGKYVGKTTNNMAEYKAVLEALKWLKKYFKSIKYQVSSIKKPDSSINFFIDSQLVVNQLNGRFKIKNSNLQHLIIKIKGLENQIPTSCYYHYIKREKNLQADKLVNQALNHALPVIRPRRLSNRQA